LVERFLKVARLADPGSPWRDRFRDPTLWRNAGQLQELAATAFTSSPPPSEHQLALLGLLLRQAGAKGQSGPLLGEAGRRHPRNFWAHREMGLAMILQNRHLEAAGYYRAALALRPGNAGAHQGLATCLSHVGQSDDAIASFREAVRASPESPHLHTR